MNPHGHSPLTTYVFVKKKEKMYLSLNLKLCLVHFHLFWGFLYLALQHTYVWHDSFSLKFKHIQIYRYEEKL